MFRFLFRVLSILATLPGIPVHELGHQLFCHLTGTRVIRVRYLRFGIPPGYVEHERPRSAWRHLLIGLGPLFFNTALGFGLGWLVVDHRIPGASIWTRQVIPLWLAVAFASQAFPSFGDAEAALDAVWRRGGGFLAKLFGTPVALLMFVGAFLANLGLDLIYGLVVGWLLPDYLQGGAVRVWLRKFGI